MVLTSTNVRFTDYIALIMENEEDLPQVSTFSNLINHKQVSVSRICFYPDRKCWHLIVYQFG